MKYFKSSSHLFLGYSNIYIYSLQEEKKIRQLCSSYIFRYIHVKKIKFLNTHFLTKIKFLARAKNTQLIFKHTFFN